MKSYMWTSQFCSISKDLIISALYKQRMLGAMDDERESENSMWSAQHDHAADDIRMQVCDCMCECKVVPKRISSIYFSLFISIYLFLERTENKLLYKRTP